MMKVLLFVLFFLLYQYLPALSQPHEQQPALEGKLTLEDIILLARQRSTEALLARHQFLVAYWEYRSFRAELLPSMSLSLTPQFNHSLVALQNAETGEYNYVQDFYMRNTVKLSMNQQISATGGSVALFSYLERLDQYKPNRYETYIAQPVNITYTQPILGVFNTLKWDKKIKPEKYKQAKYDYLEAMESIVLEATSDFFNLLLAEHSLKQARQNFAYSERLVQIARERNRIGTVNNNELMQLELNRLNADIQIRKQEVQVRLARYNLVTLLNCREAAFELIIPEKLLSLYIDEEEAYQLSVNNTSVELEMQLGLLEAEKVLAQAKARRGLQLNLYTQFGLNQSSDELGTSYHNLRDRESVQIGVQIPIVDWGMGRGRVKTAKSQQEVVQTQWQQYLTQQRQTMMIQVLQFNHQYKQCEVAAQADSMANARYQGAIDLFSKGKLSVLELNTAQTEKDNASSRYLTEISNYWKYYYTLQRYTLYDFKERRNLSADFDRLIQN